MAVLRVGALAEQPLAAAARFHAEVLPQVAEARDGDLVLVFGPADYRHTAWRRAVVQQLARDHAPRRVNALAADDETAITAALTYLGMAEGVTGQYLPLDGSAALALLSREQ
jgi:hypothetical protein